MCLSMRHSAVQADLGLLDKTRFSREGLFHMSVKPAAMLIHRYIRLPPLWRTYVRGAADFTLDEASFVHFLGQVSTGKNWLLRPEFDAFVAAVYIAEDVIKRSD